MDGGLGVLLIVLLVYFLPSIVASGRSHHNLVAILVLNLLLGWTLIGWVAALVWACTAVQAKPQQPAETVPAFPVTPGGAIRWHVEGVDRDTGMEVTEYVTAESESNARIKAELKGVVVSAVNPVVATDDDIVAAIERLSAQQKHEAKVRDRRVECPVCGTLLFAASDQRSVKCSNCGELVSAKLADRNRTVDRKR